MNDELLYPRIRSYVMEAPWAVLPSMLTTILDVLAYRANGGRLTAEEIQQRIGAVSRPAASQAGNIAILPLFGIIGHRMGSMTEMSGGTSVERFTAQFRALMADPSVGAVIVDVDSPGGAVSGTPELADEIYRARSKKKIVSVSNAMMASAAFWVGAAASEVYALPSAEVGSVGVICAHTDVSGQMEREGVRTTLITAGEHKGEGNMWEPLSTEARDFLQSRVSDYYGMFVGSLARSRGVSVDTVKSAFGGGRMLGAKAAKAAGMIDGIATMDEVIARLSREMRQGRGGAVAELDEADIRVGIAVSGATATATFETITATGGETATVSPFVAGPLPPHKSLAIAPDDAPWDGPGEVAKASGAMELRRMHAWMDGEGDPDAKSSYKMPHHKADGTLVPKGCTAVMGAMHGGRGGVDIPEGDRAGVNRHMQGHYEEMSKPMPMMDGAATGLGVDARRRRLRLAGRA